MAGSNLTYSVISGTLPTGLSLNPSTGAITGTVTTATGSVQQIVIEAQNSAAKINTSVFMRVYSTTVEVPANNTRTCLNISQGSGCLNSSLPFSCTAASDCYATVTHCQSLSSSPCDN